MPSCAACQTPFTKEFRGLKCTLCDDRRVAEPAYYCDRACQKTHWREHKAFHARVERVEQTMRANVRSDGISQEQLAMMEDAAASSNQMLSLIARSDQARLRREHREAVKWAKKAIALPRSVRRPQARLVHRHAAAQAHGGPCYRCDARQPLSSADAH